jgi:hypothetical protein
VFEMPFQSGPQTDVFLARHDPRSYGVLGLGEKCAWDESSATRETSAQSDFSASAILIVPRGQQVSIMVAFAVARRRHVHVNDRLTLYHNAQNFLRISAAAAQGSVQLARMPAGIPVGKFPEIFSARHCCVFSVCQDRRSPPPLWPSDDIDTHAMGEPADGALSYAQRYHLRQNGCVDNETLISRVSVDCDPEALSSAFQHLINRHPLLRTNFHTISTEVAVEHSSLPAGSTAAIPAPSYLAFTHAIGSIAAQADFHVVDCSQFSHDVPSFIHQEAFREFDLAKSSMLRARLFLNAGKHMPGGVVAAPASENLAAFAPDLDGVKRKTVRAGPVSGQHVLMISVAPIVADKWSLTNLLDDLKGLSR